MVINIHTSGSDVNSFWCKEEVSERSHSSGERGLRSVPPSPAFAFREKACLGENLPSLMSMEIYCINRFKYFLRNVPDTPLATLVQDHNFKRFKSFNIAKGAFIRTYISTRGN